MQRPGKGTEHPINKVELLRAQPTKLERVSRKDLAERKKAEQTLWESEEKFRSVFDNANDIIASVSKTGKILEGQSDRDRYSKNGRRRYRHRLR